MSINWDKVAVWCLRTGVRAIKTGAQAIIGCIGTDAANIVSLDWPQILGIAALAAVAAVCTSIAGIPEVEDGASIFKIAKE